MGAETEKNDGDGEKKPIKCPYCGYEWIPRREHPIECPRCKKYLV